jgi:hypothetical protein
MTMGMTDPTVDKDTDLEALEAPVDKDMVDKGKDHKAKSSLWAHYHSSSTETERSRTISSKK